MDVSLLNCETKSDIMRHMVLVGIMFLFIITTGCVDVDEELDSNEVINHTLETYNQADDFTVQIIIRTVFNKAEYVEVMNYSLIKPDKYKLEDIHSGAVTICDGKKVQIYDPVENTVTQKITNQTNTVPDCDYRQILSELIAAYQLKPLMIESSSNRHCFVIKAVPIENDHLPDRTIWIDKEQWIPLKIKNDYGFYQSSMAYENISFDIGLNDDDIIIPLPSSTEIRSMPHINSDFIGLDEAQDKTNFSILIPSYTSGYLFTGASVPQYASDSISLVYTNESNNLIITQVFSSEIEPLSDAESVRLSNGWGEFADGFGSNNIFRFARNHTNTAIIGVMDKKEFIKIAESMEYM